MLRRDARSKNWQRFRSFMSDPFPSAMGIIFNEVCVLVRQPSRSRSCQALGSRSVLCCRGAIKERLCWSLRFSALSKKPLFHTPACLTSESWRYARGRSRSGSLGGTGRRRVCHLVSRRAPRPAVRLHCNFHVVRWFGRRIAVPLAPEAGATPNNGILSDIGSNLAPQCPHFPLRS
jgi:hypothetical protein